MAPLMGHMLGQGTEEVLGTVHNDAMLWHSSPIAPAMLEGFQHLKRRWILRGFTKQTTNLKGAALTQNVEPTPLLT